MINLINSQNYKEFLININKYGHSNAIDFFQSLIIKKTIEKKHFNILKYFDKYITHVYNKDYRNEFLKELYLERILFLNCGSCGGDCCEYNIKCDVCKDVNLKYLAKIY